jgi:leucine dehydrogenase
MKASAQHVWGKDSLSGKKIAVQGIGKVGGHLIERLHAEGAILFISDINESVLSHYAKEFGATVVKGDDIYSLDVDIFAPCAMGAILNTENINKLKCAVVAGAANNQLADENIHGPLLVEKGIAYAPDFLINAGGLINVYQEHIGYNRDTAMRNTEHIYDVTLRIYNEAAAKKIHTQRAATELAEKRIADIRSVRATY